MRTPARLAAFAAALAVAFGAAALVGAAVDPLRDPADRASADGHADPHGGAEEAPEGAGHGTPTGPAGLAVAEDGLRLEADPPPAAGAAADWSFRIAGPGGETITDFEVEHERRMHLIVVRRDLTGYRHLHPRLGADGRWHVRLRLEEPGVHRAFADFRSGGRARTLGTDLAVPGDFRPRPLPAPAPVASDGDHRADLSAENARGGATAELTYRLTRRGRPLDGVEPYLGADGHLVALREGDLAFLHVHPEESREPGVIRFGAELPSAGRYRLFLQYRHGGAVRTVAHTLEAAR